jgi:lipase
MRLHLHEWGDPAAPAIVCLHGITGHGLRFRRLAEERLADRFRVLAPDLRGHGRSEHEPPWTFATFVEDVLETIDSAGVGSAGWIGHSFGGRLVLEIAAAAPERVERVALLDTAFHVLPHVALFRAETVGEDYASPEEAVAARLQTDPDSPRDFVEEDVEQHLEHAPDGSYRFRYCRSTAVSVYGELATQPPPPETVRVPMLIVHAPAFGLVRGEHLAAYPDAEILAVPGGHMVYWDAWEQTADAVERFLENPSA